MVYSPLYCNFPGQRSISTDSLMPVPLWSQLPKTKTQFIPNCSVMSPAVQYYMHRATIYPHMHSVFNYIRTDKIAYLVLSETALALGLGVAIFFDFPCSFSFCSTLDLFSSYMHIILNGIRSHA